MNMRAIVSAALVTALAASANAAVIWDQSDIDTNPDTSRSFVDGTITGGFGGAFSWYVVSDVHIGSESLIQSVTTYFSRISTFNDPTTAVLNIFPKSGSLPLASNDPRPSPGGTGMLVVPVVGGYEDDNQAVMTITASGLNIVLAPGDYWIGLSPTLPGGFFGNDLHWSTTAATQYGDPSADRYYDSLGAAAWGNTQSEVSTRDAAITITGIVPAPGAMGALGLAGIFAARRRR